MKRAMNSYKTMNSAETKNAQHQNVCVLVVVTGRVGKFQSPTFYIIIECLVSIAHFDITHTHTQQLEQAAGFVIVASLFAIC